MRPCLVAIFSILFLTTGAQAATRYVGGCGSPNAGSIAAAVSASATGDSILICPGTYTLGSAIVIGTPGLTLESSSGNRADVTIQNHTTTVVSITAPNTTLRALTLYSNPQHAVHANGADNLWLDGVTSNSEFGNGLRLENLVGARLSNYRSTAGNNDAAIRLINAGNLTLDGTANALASRQRAILGDAGRPANLKIDGATISAIEPIRLGNSGQVEIRNSGITAGNGGAGMVLQNAGGDHVFDNLTVKGGDYVGGLFLYGGDSASFTDVDVETTRQYGSYALYLANMRGDVSFRAINKPRVTIKAINGDPNGNHALYLSAAANLTLTLEKVDITARLNGIWQRGSGVTANFTDVAINAGNHGIYFENGRDAHNLAKVTVAAAQLGIYLNGGKNALLSELNLTAQTGLRLNNQTDPKLSGANKVRLSAANGYGILIENSNNSLVSGATVDGGAYANAMGIYLWNSNSGEVRGNQVSNTTHHGILASGNSSSARIQGNLVENSAQGSGRYGVYLVANSGRAWDNCLYNARNAWAVGSAEFYEQSEKHGNFWGSWPKGSGYSDSCADANGDGICDVAYAYQSGKEDKFPMRQLPACGASGGSGGTSSPAALNAVDVGAHPVAGKITTKSAGAAFSLDLHALNATRTGPDTAINGGILVDLLVNTQPGVALDANNCPTSATVLPVGTVTLASGKATASMGAIADAWRDARVRMRYPASGAASLTACSADNFAVKPATLSAIASHADWQTAGVTTTLANSGASGGAIHKAGKPFTLRVTGYNANNVVTGNYSGSPTAVATCVLPASGCVAGALDGGAYSANAGTAISHTASYSEVGAISAVFTDSAWASVDAGDTAAGCAGHHVCSGAIQIGRFVPDHFDIATNTAAFAPACGGFTYLGQPFGFDPGSAVAPLWTVSAKNAGGTLTRNYSGSLFKISAAAVTGQAWSAASGTVAAVGTLPAVGVTDLGGGLGRLLFSVGAPASGGGLAFSRATPLAPFDANLTLAASVADSEGVTHAGNPYQHGGIGFNDGNTATTSDAQMRFGRLRLTNAVGSELLPLPVPLTAQFWNGQGYVSNSADNCTTISSPAITFFSQAADNQLAAGETTASFNATLIAGNGNLWFSAPGAGNFGFMDLRVAAPAWLKFNWDGVDQGGDGDLLDDDPRARATFGKRRGSDKVIIRREMY